MEKQRVNNKLFFFILIFIGALAIVSSQLYLFPALILAEENSKSKSEPVPNKLGQEIITAEVFLEKLAGAKYIERLNTARLSHEKEIVDYKKDNPGQKAADHKMCDFGGEAIDHITCDEENTSSYYINVGKEVKFDKGVEVQGNIPEIRCVKWKEKVDISNSLIQNDLIISNSIFEDGFNFSKSQFNGDLQFNYLKSYGNSWLDESEFNGELVFFDSQFGKKGNEPGEGKLSIEKSIFKKTVNLLESEFNYRTAFRNCRFHDFAIFGIAPKNEFKIFKQGKQDKNSSKAAFNNGADFSQSIFYRKASFIFTEFINADFTDAVFLGPVQFIKAKFLGNTDFVRADFKGTADFDRAIFALAPPKENIEPTGYANFYRSRFGDAVSFSKVIFITDTDFKRASFKNRAVFTNTLFLSKSKSKFEMSFFDRGFFGSKINDIERLKKELVYYEIKKELAALDKNKIFSDEEKIFSNEYDTYVEKFINKQYKDMDQGFHNQEKNCKNTDEKKCLAEFWKGKVAFIDNDAFEILRVNKIAAPIVNIDNAVKQARNKDITTSIVDIENVSDFNFKGAHFNGEVDLRDSIFGEIDFSSGEMVTIFNGPVDFSKALFRKIYLDDTIFMNKVHLSLKDSFFRESKLISEKSFFTDLGWIFADDEEKDDEDNGDALATRDDKLGQLYSQLEPLFRKNMQVVEANEMSIRKAIINLDKWEALLSSIFIVFALPIKNIFYATLIILTWFYGCIFISIFLNKNDFARVHELHFKPGKIPLIVLHELGPSIKTITVPGSREKKEIELANKWWQKVFWPAYLCFGTFFALLSLGNEYVTNDSQCLKCMKWLRVAGFIILPLFLYSLAKRSVGMHSIVSFLF